MGVHASILIGTHYKITKYTLFRNYKKSTEKLTNYSEDDHWSASKGPSKDIDSQEEAEDGAECRGDQLPHLEHHPGEGEVEGAVPQLREQPRNRTNVEKKFQEDDEGKLSWRQHQEAEQPCVPYV